MRYQLSLRCSDDERDREGRYPDRSGYESYKDSRGDRIAQDHAR